MNIKRRHWPILESVTLEIPPLTNRDVVNTVVISIYDLDENELIDQIEALKIDILTKYRNKKKPVEKENRYLP